MYGSHAPPGVVSVPMSRACTIPVVRLDSAVNSLPSCTNWSSSSSRISTGAFASAVKHLSATGSSQMRCIARNTTPKPPSPTTCKIVYLSATIVPTKPKRSLGSPKVPRL